MCAVSVGEGVVRGSDFSAVASYHDSSYVVQEWQLSNSVGGFQVVRRGSGSFGGLALHHSSQSFLNIQPGELRQTAK